MSLSINGTSGLVFNDGSSQNTSPFTGGLGFRNRIINGDFRIDQRNAGASLTIAADNTYTLDRWKAEVSANSKFSVQQNAGSVTPPPGFSHYLGVTSLSSYSSTSSDYLWLAQFIEGFNTADLAWGTANAATVTLSFWVRSSLTGTFGGALTNNNVSRCYPFSYTMNTANTWEQKSITIAGDTSGTWVGGTNGNSIRLHFNLGTGSTRLGSTSAWGGTDYRGGLSGATSVVGTNGATFYITGVQLEKGSTATSFDYRPYGTELQLCQRYYYRIVYSGSNTPLCTTYNRSASAAIGCFVIPVEMRATPSLSVNSGTNYFHVSAGGGDWDMSTVSIEGAGTYLGKNSASVAASISGATTGQGGMLFINNASALFSFTAEL